MYDIKQMYFIRCDSENGLNHISSVKLLHNKETDWEIRKTNIRIHCP
jgi:hypothetical protein